MEKSPKNDLELAKTKDSESDSPEEEAPEGGWGWMVTIGYSIAWITTLWPGLSFTFVFEDFLEDTGQAGSLTTLFTSLFSISYYVSSLATSLLLKYLSMRTLGIFSAFLFTIPNIMMAFVRTPMELSALFLFQGTGIGFIFMILNINFNAYFVKKRSKVMSITQVVIGLGGIIYPLATEKLMEEYGYRGTAAILGALNLHCIFAMALMRPPPEFNRIKPKLNLADESKEPLVSTNSLLKIKRLENWNSRRSLKDDLSNSVGSFDKLSGNRWSSLTSLRIQPGIDTLLLAQFTSVENNIKKNLDSFGSRIQRIIPTEYLELMCDRSFMITCVGASFTLTSDFVFCSFLPMIMTSHGYSKADAALTVTTSMAAELASRIGLAIFTTLIYDARPRHVFFVAMIGSTLARLGFMYFENTLSGAMIMIGTSGVVRSLMLVPQSLVIVEDLRVDQFGAAYGIFAIVSGVISITFGPLAGFVKDWTGSFAMCQIVLIAMNALFIVPWSINIMIDNKKTHT